MDVQKLIEDAARAVTTREITFHEVGGPVDEFARDDVRAALPVIVAAVTDEVRKLHREEVSVFYRRDLAGDDYSETYPWCVVCGLAYPCSTVRLLDSLDAEAGRTPKEKP